MSTESVEELHELGPLTVALLRPPDVERWLDEEAFARDEYLPYWAELWPAARALAAAVADRALAGARVLELGCGLGLPSVAAALGGATVLATDWSEDALRFVELNAARNGVDVETALLDWRAPADELLRRRFDLVLASDVLYETRNAEVLLELLPRLGAEALLADPGRPALPAFLEGAARAFAVETRPDATTARMTLVSLRPPGLA